MCIRTRYCHVSGGFRFVRVRESTIPSAGLGVFAIRNFPAGMHYLGQYKGQLITGKTEADIPRASRGLVVEIQAPSRRRSGIWVDGSVGGNWVTKVQCSGPMNRPNVRLIKGENAKLGLYTIRGVPIKRGDELFVDYGSQYWVGDFLGKRR